MTSLFSCNTQGVPFDIALAILHHKDVLPRPPSPPIIVIVPFGIYPGTSHSTYSFSISETLTRFILFGSIEVSGSTFLTSCFLNRFRLGNTSASSSLSVKGISRLSSLITRIIFFIVSNVLVPSHNCAHCFIK